MERIIYRVWDKGNKRMLYGESFHANFYTEPKVGKCVCGVAHSFSKSEPMLQSGLTDINNKQIFEGDIVELGCNDKYVVDFQQGGFCFKNIKQKLMIWALNDGKLITQAKIIGNIYKNPEMLPVSFTVFV